MQLSTSQDEVILFSSMTWICQGEWERLQAKLFFRQQEKRGGGGVIGSFYLTTIWVSLSVLQPKQLASINKYQGLGSKKARGGWWSLHQSGRETKAKQNTETRECNSVLSIKLSRHRNKATLCLVFRRQIQLKLSTDPHSHVDAITHENSEKGLQRKAVFTTSTHHF